VICSFQLKSVTTLTL